MRTYLDTSALVKLYYPEKESEMLTQWVTHANEPVPYTPLHELELQNAFSLKIFRREVSRSQRTQLKRVLENDFRKGVLLRVDVNWGEVFAQAIKLSDAYTFKLGCRSADILQVALALKTDYLQFLSFDDRQKALARKAGLRVISL